MLLADTHIHTFAHKNRGKYFIAQLEWNIKNHLCSMVFLGEFVRSY